MAEISAVQAEVVTRRQLGVHGVTRDVVRSNVRAGRWQTMGRRVVVLHNGPLTLLQRQWVGVLAQPTGAVLAGLTAATAAGLTGFDEQLVHVLLPHGAHPVPVEGVVTHVSRRSFAGDVHPVLLPPRTRLDRAVVDAVVWESNRSRACGILAAAVQQRLTTAARLASQLARLEAVARLPLYKAVVADIEGGAQSLAEIDFGPLCARAGMPAPRRQAVRLDGFGRRRYLDVDCDGFSVEVDGAFHLRPLNWIDDSLRQNELVILGERILRMPSILVRLDQDIVVDQLARAYRAFGRWAG